MMDITALCVRQQVASVPLRSEMGPGAAKQRFGARLTERARRRASLESRRRWRGCPPVSAALGEAGELDLRTLGKSGLTVSSMGIGTRKWGDTGEGFGGRFDEEDLSLVFETAISSGCNLFDTDEVYGYQSIGSGRQAEQQLGRLKQLWSHPARPQIVVGTKYCPLPWANRFVGGEVRGGKEGMLSALQASLGRLGESTADLWQIQNPVEASNGMFMEGLAEAVESGLVQAVGVCNFNKEQLEAALESLDKRGIPLASAQVRYSIFHRAPEVDGVLDLCSREGVTLIAHSPLDGRLAGAREAMESEEVAVLKLLEFVGAVAYQGKTATQVAVNYLITKGAIPIPGCTSPDHAEELLGAMGWRLDEDDVALIDEKLTYHKF